MIATESTVGERLEKWAWKLDRRPVLFVALLAVIYVILIWPSVNRPLWFDELHTFYIAQASSVQEFTDEIRLVDLNPPLSYLVVRGSMDIFGRTEFGARFPSIVGYFLGSMALFVFIKRRVGPLWGAAGVAVFWSNPFFSLSTEARPYAILLGFFGLALVSWDRVANYAADGSERRRGLAGIVVGVTGMLLSHVYAPLWVMAFWTAELWRAWRQRRVDWPLWSTLVVPMVACVVYLPLIRNVSQGVFPPGFQGSMTKAFWFYVLIFIGVLPALIAASFGAFAVAIWRGRAVAKTFGSPAISPAGFQPPESAFFLTALVPPALLNIIATHSHTPFYERHGFLTVLTASLFIVLFMAYESRGNRLSGLVAALLTIVFSVVLLRGLDLNAASPDPIQPASVGKDFNQIHPELPLVANSALTYLQMDHYENSAVLARLYYLVDARSSIKYSQSNLTEGLLVLKRYFPIRANVSSYDDFVKTHRHFMVFGDTGYQQGWLLTKLKDEGAQVTEIGHLDTVYKDSNLYEVQLNP